MPSLVDRPAFLVAEAIPRLRRIVVASSRLPFASVRAALHSIMPAPVASRSFLTMSAVITMSSLTPEASTSLPRLPALEAESWQLEAGTYKRRRARRPRRRHMTRARLNGGRGRGLLGTSLAGGTAAPGALVTFRLLGLLGLCRFPDAAARDDRVCDPRGEQADGSQGVVVAGDHEVDFVGIAVGVHDADDRDLQLARLIDRDLLLAGVHHEERVGQPRHVADPFEVLLQLLLFLLDLRDLFLGERFVPAVGFHRLEIPQPREAALNRREVGQQSAEPPLVDEEHPAALGLFGNRVLRLPLRAHE